MRHVGSLRGLLLILAVVGLVLSPVVLPVQVVAMPEMSGTDSMPCCDDGPLVPGCKVACPLTTSCPSDYGPSVFVVDAPVSDRDALAGNRLPRNEASLENLGTRPLFPPPRI